MSIAQMQKVLIASFRTEAADALESLQSSGIMQILDAEQAIVSKEWPELHTEIERPKQVEELSTKIDSAVEFLKQYAPKATLAETLAPRVVVSEKEYTAVIRTDQALEMLERCGELANQLHKLGDRHEHLQGQLNMLLPWKKLDIDLADLEKLEKGAVILGLIPEKNFTLIQEKIKDFRVAVEKVGTKDNLIACAVATLKENSAEVYKALRSIEFEAVNLSSFKGTPAELIKNTQIQLKQTHQQIETLEKQAKQLGKNRLKLQILADHYRNLLDRERTRLAVPKTEQTVLLEGWVKKRDLKKLQNILAKFKGTSLSLIRPAENEDVPVEIENATVFKPFEVITRLYGMPRHSEVDPTWLLAPFFAIFFALCLSDVGYGIMIIAASVFLIKKMQGGKGLLWLLILCSILTIAAGAMTGGWFGTGLRELAVAWKINWLVNFIDKTTWFDPLQDPMKFFAISIALGYLQIMTGLFIGFVDCLRRKEFAAAICDKLVWLVLVNSLAVFGAGKMGAISASSGSIAARVAIVPAIIILLFSQREGPVSSRLAMGAYQLFSTVFYLGDILSYLRLMALGIASGGVAMAINIIARTVSEVPYVGIVLAIVLLVLGHTFNAVMSGIGSFVHSLRLQFVEYFPKFFVGGGREFAPLIKQYKYVYIKTDKVKR